MLVYVVVRQTIVFIVLAREATSYKAFNKYDFPAPAGISPKTGCCVQHIELSVSLYLLVSERCNWNGSTIAVAFLVVFPIALAARLVHRTFLLLESSDTSFLPMPALHTELPSL